MRSSRQPAPVKPAEPDDRPTLSDDEWEMALDTLTQAPDSKTLTANWNIIAAHAISDDQYDQAYELVKQRRREFKTA
jgi:hypothetical protein